MSDNVEQFDIEVKQSLGIRITGADLIGGEDVRSLEALYESQFQELLSRVVDTMRGADDHVSLVVTEFNTKATITEVPA